MTKLSKEVRGKFLACLFVKHLGSGHEKPQEDLHKSHAMGNKEAHPASTDGATDLIDSHKNENANKQAKELIKAE